MTNDCLILRKLTSKTYLISTVLPELPLLCTCSLTETMGTLEREALENKPGSEPPSYLKLLSKVIIHAHEPQSTKLIGKGRCFTSITSHPAPFGVFIMSTSWKNLEGGEAPHGYNRH